MVLSELLNPREMWWSTCPKHIVIYMHGEHLPKAK